MQGARAHAARHCAHTTAQGASQDQASLKHRSFDQNLNKAVQTMQLSNDRNAAHQYLTVTDFTGMCLDLSGTKRLGFGNFEAFLDLKSSILFIRQQECILLFLDKASACICTGPS